jgi:DNA-binding CsgD family transcriptional regulator
LVAFERADPDSIDLAREGYRLAFETGDPAVVRLARFAMAHILTWMRRPAEATAWLEAELQAVGYSNELSRHELTWYLALVDVMAGRWDTALDRAHESAVMSHESGFEPFGDDVPQRLVAVYRGRPARLRTSPVEIEQGSDFRHTLRANLILGLEALWDGRPADALERLEQLEQAAKARGMGDPGHVLSRPERVEALLQLDRIDEAERAIEPWESEAARLGRDWIVAEATRCRGLVAAARGDIDLAVQLLERAVEDHAAAGDPFGRARALLALGGVRRRHRQKRLARQALEGALAAFEELDAPRWIVLARTEIGRLGGRQRITELSPSERRVAELAADGRTNREIAVALFLGQRTVATHLTHAYAKLGVRSRTELVRALDAPSSTGAVGTTPSKNQTS